MSAEGSPAVGAKTGAKVFGVLIGEEVLVEEPGAKVVGVLVVGDEGDVETGEVVVETGIGAEKGVDVDGASVFGVSTASSVSGADAGTGLGCGARGVGLPMQPQTSLPQ
mgnify:CR=1 FL=1